MPPIFFPTEDAAIDAATPSGKRNKDGRDRAVTLGQLGAQFAHDFNNVLAVALTSVEMAMRVGDTEKANIFLANALKVIARGRVLTERLAAASYACEAPAAVDVHALIQTICAGDATGEASAPHRVATNLGASRTIVNADPDFLGQALRNLIANARESMDAPGALTVSTRNASGSEVRGEPGRDYIVIAINDTGGGMPDDVRLQAFELFFSTRSVEGEAGRGIGLAQVKDAIRRAGGSVSIESNVGQGTTVTFAIPLLVEAA